MNITITAADTGTGIEIEINDGYVRSRMLVSKPAAQMLLDYIDDTLGRQIVPHSVAAGSETFALHFCKGKADGKEDGYRLRVTVRGCTTICHISVRQLEDFADMIDDALKS